MTDVEQKFEKELRDVRTQLDKAIKLAQHYGVQDKLQEAFRYIDDAYVWFVQTHS